MIDIKTELKPKMEHLEYIQQMTMVRLYKSSDNTFMDNALIVNHFTQDGEALTTALCNGRVLPAVLDTSQWHAEIISKQVTVTVEPL